MLFTTVTCMYGVAILFCICRGTLSCNCRTDAPETSSENVGKVLVNETFASLSIRSVTLCAVRCLRQKKCKSINFDRKERICALNTETHQTRPEQFGSTSTSFLVYYDISDWKQILKTPCVSHTCGDDKICIPGYLGQGQSNYVCLDDFSADVVSSQINYGIFEEPCIITTSCADCTPTKSIEVAGTAVVYKAVGCYVSAPDNVLSTLIKNYRGGIDWSDWEASFTEIIQNCATESQNYSFFGVEFYGECYAGSNLEVAATSQGEVSVDSCDSKCFGGVGGDQVMFVYRWV